MGHLQTQNLTRAPARPEVAHWGPTAQQSPAVNVTVVLGVLTFGLQLCLVLYFAFRCRRLENKIQKPVSKGAALSSVYRGISKQASYQRCSQDSSSSPIMPVASCQHTNPPLVFAPSIPWDLVQG